MGKIQVVENINGHQSGVVYGGGGISPTLPAFTHGYALGWFLEVKKVEEKKNENEVICLNSKGGRGGVDGLQPSLQDRVFDTDGVSFAMTTGFQPSILVVGQMDNTKDHTFESANRVYSGDGLAPTIPTSGGGGITPKVLEYECIEQTVKVRKYEVDKMKLCDLLRKSKSEKKISNKEIAERLNVNITNVEHWFRRDKSFSIPDPEIWMELKELLGIKTQKYDLQVMEFEERPGVFEKSERTYFDTGLSPTITAATNGEKVLTVVAMRGRDPEKPSDRTSGNKNLVQRLEPNSEGICNTLTTVQKDNMVLQMVRTEEGKRIRKAYENHEIKAGFNEYREPRPRKDGCTNTITTVQKDNLVLVKQATKDGYIPCEIGGVADLSYPTSETRRGRVIDRGNVSPTLTTENIPSVLEKFTWEIDGVKYLIRIRKLTPRECWRLMGFTDEDFDKAQSVNSNTQLYKQAGNSIVKDCLMAIFSQMGISGVKKWNESQ